MKLKTLLTLIATLSLGLQFASAADDDTPLSKEMAAMNKSLRLLKRQVADPAKKQDNLELLAKIRKNVEEAHKYEPVRAKTVPEAERKAYIEKYNKQMTELDKTFEKLEAALKADNQDEAKAAFEKLQEQKEQGHKDFTDDE